MQNLTREDPLNKVQQKWMSGEIPVVVATIAFGMSIDKANAKKGLSDDVKDIQIKALQTGFEKMLEYCEKRNVFSSIQMILIFRPNADTMLASFFNESDLKKCVEELRFLQNSRAGSGRQFLPDRQPADIEYNSCYLQSKTLSSYNHKAAQSYVVFI
ncbi:hypothetical protein WR25_01978 [Diploscapter pachys]|uniref:Uncharacterized protein n=1 Tax=Diploscapter pachys TaxID=2018661 RepID=A0A2A2JEY4_9BILA|nr:hypothetical protein WR25_01978 [Diploscapter pachys]